jgi:hypothetical protein
MRFMQGVAEGVTLSIVSDGFQPDGGNAFFRSLHESCDFGTREKQSCLANLRSCWQEKKGAASAAPP